MTNRETTQRLLDQLPQTHHTVGLGRKRFRRSKSTPVSEIAPVEINEIKNEQSLLHSKSILDKLHPSIRKVIVYLVIYLGIGTICFYFVRSKIKGKKIDGVLDSLYFCVVTMTTVGYGDLVPNSATTKLFACVFVFSGMTLVGLVLSKAADYLVEKQETLLIKALHMGCIVGPGEILEEIETNKIRYKCFMVAAFLITLIVIGTVVLARVEKFDTVDAFYCVCATITTLGYGDKSFSTKAGRIFAIFWILTGTLCLGRFFLYVAEWNTEKRQKEIVKWVLSRRTTNVDLEEADLDDDGVVGAAEFVIYKLKEMGKINQQDVTAVLKEFESLDVDQSGTLSTADLALAQSS
ncbi:two-pore potassium channel 1 [Solanum lycopersicum]|uniref:Potassium channel domain-containing protein n=1 Tax=Solanum lycopersicum TaxID=4081 RepID=A0A3Q7HFY9_SOLLC|nr:two-pore potassium channel 1 [Solanum lycopersicum]XP_010324268.1 two-pore potassium channel 1 [Solanum lycopersicum]XP_025887963.1 two-pore potassium channel 1 [Solanum lycopersicum]